MTRPIYINGKFYGAGLNGVHRVADRLIHEIDQFMGALPADQRLPIRLVVPKGQKWPLRLNVIEVVEKPMVRGPLWEQLMLPVIARDGLLLNLCNLAPVAHLDKLTMIHDAQFLFPDNSYPLPTRLLHRLLSPAIARTSHRVITVSDYSRQMLSLLGVAPRDRIMVLLNGADHLADIPADPSVLAKHGLQDGRFVVHIASGKEYKNTRVIFDAFRLPALDHLPLVVVGPGRPELEAAGLKPPENTVFAGKVDDGQLRALYQSAACLVFPSRTEGFGLPPAEAMNLGCPAVVAPAGAIPEVCGDAVLYAGVDDPDAWVAAILQFDGDAPLRQRKVEVGRARMSHLTWSIAGQKLGSELLRLASAARP